MKSLEELQEARKRNDAEAERICNNIKLCCGWSIVLGLFVYLIILIISILTNDFNYNKSNSILVLEDDSSNTN